MQNHSQHGELFEWMLSRRCLTGNIHRHITASRDSLCSQLVAEEQPALSEKHVLDLIRLGSVYCNSQRLDCDVMVSSGSYIRVHASPRRYPAAHIDWKSQLLHVDRDAGNTAHILLPLK